MRLSSWIRRTAAIIPAIAAASCIRITVKRATSDETSPAISARDLERRLTAFAHDSMMGREAGTIWNEKATAYIAAQFAKYGLKPAGENGTWFQVVPDIRTRDTTHRAPARNVIAILEGSDPALKNEYVSITAHNDHIGYTNAPVDHDSLRAYNLVVRPMGADSPNRPATADDLPKIRALLDSLRRLRPARPDSIRNGADDDGSGTIALIELAEAFGRNSVKPKRSILFVSHTAEEKGLIGSAYFTDHPTVPLDNIVAEIDVDMIGRGGARDIKGGGPTYLEVIGLRRLSNEFGDLLEAANKRQATPFVFDFQYDAPGHPLQYYCRADHYSYARYGIPSVSLSRGAHVDYHMITDEPQYINYPDYARLVQMVYDGLTTVANADRRPQLSVPKPTDPKAGCRQ